MRCLEHRCIFFQRVLFSSYSAKGPHPTNVGPEPLVGRCKFLLPIQGRPKFMESRCQHYLCPCKWRCTHVPLCPCSEHTFQWKIQVCLDLRKSDKEVIWGKKAGGGGRDCWPMVGPLGWDAVHENLNSVCQGTSQGLCTCSSSALHTVPPLLLMSGTFLPYSSDVSSVEKVPLTTQSKAAPQFLSHSPIVFYSWCLPEMVLLMYLFMGLLSSPRRM